MNIKCLFIVCFTIVSLASCKEKTQNEAVIRPVKVERVKSLNKIQKSFSGVVAPDQFSDLAYKMSGPLTKMNVLEGQQVKKGDVIAEMDPTDFKLDYEARKASFEEAKAALERAKKLLSRGAISVQDFEANQAAFVTAKSAYENTVNTLKGTKLLAPFDGFIQKRYVENYQRVQSGEGVVCLVNPNKLQVDFTLPENNIDYITDAENMYVEFDAYKGKMFKAKLREYVRASVAGAGIPVTLNIVDDEFNLDKYHISVGYSCRVFIDRVNDDKKEMIAVPLSAIVFNNKSNKKSLFVYDENTKKVEQREIFDSGIIVDKENVVVGGNVKAGEKIVVAGATRLVNGQTVKLINK